jgi:hemerythrin superfamily protein
MKNTFSGRESHSAKESAKESPIVPNDIVDLILEDHKPLKELIKTLKDPGSSFEQKVSAYGEFAPLLVCHAKPEELTLYVFMKRNKEMRSEAMEGDVEHGLADQLLEEIKRTNDKDLWAAKVKVLAELVEHHIQEEESDLLPDFKKHSEKSDREKLGQVFLTQKIAMLEQGGEDTVEESDLDVRH